MNDVNIITAPDILPNDGFNICLICVNDLIRQQLHELLLNSPLHINVYWYDGNSVDELEWLLTVIKLSNIIILDNDNCSFLTNCFVSHIIAQPNCFYLTNNNSIPYNLLSKNRIYDLAWLENILNRGKNEQALT